MDVGSKRVILSIMIFHFMCFILMSSGVANDLPDIEGDGFYSIGFTHQFAEGGSHVFMLEVRPKSKLAIIHTRATSSTVDYMTAEQIMAIFLKDILKMIGVFEKKDRGAVDDRKDYFINFFISTTSKRRKFEIPVKALGETSPVMQWLQSIDDLYLSSRIVTSQP